MTKKERSKLASELGKKSWKARKKPKALEHLRKIASKEREEQVEKDLDRWGLKALNDNRVRA